MPCPGAGGLIARAANRHVSKSHREAAGVLSAAQRHTHFLDSTRIAQVVAASGFAFANLKDEVAKLFLILPMKPACTLRSPLSHGEYRAHHKSASIRLSRPAIKSRSTASRSSADGSCSGSAAITAGCAAPLLTCQAASARPAPFK